jgi:catechol 2,3-dioxygenase-like lactoylglutathione lyase family enzyme
MSVNYCFELVIAVRDHDESVSKYRDMLGIAPIELASESLPMPETRCTIFPLSNLGDRGMLLTLLSSTTPTGPIAERIASSGEGLMGVGFDVDDIEDAIRRGKLAGAEFEDDTPLPYDYGRMVTTRPSSTHGVPMVFSAHNSDWWQKVISGGR